MSEIYSLNFTLGGSNRIRVLDVDVTGYPLSFLSISATKDVSWEFYLDKNINDLVLPGTPTLTPATTGGTIPRSTTVYVRITTVDAVGLEGPPTVGFMSATTGTTTDTNKITVLWSAVIGAASYNIYASTRSGSEVFIGNTVGTSLVLTDTPGAATIGAQIPTMPLFLQTSTTGGSQGTDFAVPPILYSRLIVYAQGSANTQVFFSTRFG